MKIEIYPLDRITIDEKTVYLNMSEKDVELLLGRGDIIGSSHYFFNSELRIDYSKNGKIEFIEFLGGTNGVLKPVIYGISAFEVPADELTELLVSKSNGNVNDSEAEYGYSFIDISVGIYRDLTPESVAEMIEEMIEDGESIENNDDVEADKIRANHWQTIGIGVKDYYK